MTQDVEHLRLLSIFHYVVAGITALFACLPIVHLVAGLFMIFAPGVFDNKGEPPPVFFGWLFVFVGALCITLGWTFAAFIFAAGMFLARRKHYMFCLVMAGLECLCQPFGTVLGVFTIVVLMRESVKQLFEENKLPVAGASPIGGPIV